MQNLITRANYEARFALDEMQTERSAAHAPPSGPSAWPQQRIALAGETLLEYMLFRNEAALAGPVRGTSAFATEFARGGPRDSQGRCLRQFRSEEHTSE